MSLSIILFPMLFPVCSHYIPRGLIGSELHLIHAKAAQAAQEAAKAAGVDKEKATASASPWMDWEDLNAKTIVYKVGHPR